MHQQIQKQFIFKIRLFIIHKENQILELLNFGNKKIIFVNLMMIKIIKCHIRSLRDTNQAIKHDHSHHFFVIPTYLCIIFKFNCLQLNNQFQKKHSKVFNFVKFNSKAFKGVINSCTGKIIKNKGVSIIFIQKNQKGHQKYHLKQFSNYRYLTNSLTFKSSQVARNLFNKIHESTSTSTDLSRGAFRLELLKKHLKLILFSLKHGHTFCKQVE